MKYATDKNNGANGAGSMPFVYSRFTRQEAASKNRLQVLPNGLLHEVKKFYYDTAQAHHAGALAALLKLVATSRSCLAPIFRTARGPKLSRG